MGVALDQSRHQCTTAQVDDPRFAGVDGAFGDLGDDLGANQNL